MRVVFLDFDGVLNSTEFAQRQYDLTKQSMKRDQLDTKAVLRLNRILMETGAVVVISSTWRKLYPLPTLHKILRAHRFSGMAIGVTPDFFFRSRQEFEETYKVPGRFERGHEIADWLERWNESCSKHNRVENFVILDDDSDMAHLKDRLIQTDHKIGLSSADTDRAIDMLRGGAE